MPKRKSVLLFGATDSSYENSYCGYCCKLIEIKSQSSAEEHSSDESDDNNYEYIILCANCNGPFHVTCTALSATPIDKIREQCLNWKCNTCVKNEAPSNVDAKSPEDVVEERKIDYGHKNRDDLIDKKLTSMLCVFGKELQNVCGKIIETETDDNGEGLVIHSIPIGVKERFLQDILSIASAKGIKLERMEQKMIISKEKISFVIRLDPHATRQLLLNSYLNSIMQPITATTTTKPTSFYLANDRDIEVSSSTCLLPHPHATSGTGLSSSNNNNNTNHLPNNNRNQHRSIYMYEYLAENASTETMLVKAITGNGATSAVIGDNSDNDVFYPDDTTSVLVPIIKISTVPKRVRLASKENFDDIEGKFMNSVIFFLLTDMRGLSDVDRCVDSLIGAFIGHKLLPDGN